MLKFLSKLLGKIFLSVVVTSSQCLVREPVLRSQGRAGLAIGVLHLGLVLDADTSCVHILIGRLLGSQKYCETNAPFHGDGSEVAFSATGACPRRYLPLRRSGNMFMQFIGIPIATHVSVAALRIRYRCSIAAILVFAAPIAASAETIDAVYRATLAGMPIGKAHLTGGVGAGAYTIRLKGEASLLGFSSRFEASSNGASQGARILPASYLLKTEGSTNTNHCGQLCRRPGC